MNKEDFYNIDQLIEYLVDTPSKLTVYQWVHYKKIPCMKVGRQLFFNKEKIRLWDDCGRPKNQF